MFIHNRPLSRHVGLVLKYVKFTSQGSLRKDFKFLLIPRTFSSLVISSKPSLYDSKHKVLSQKSNYKHQLPSLCQLQPKNFNTSSYFCCNASSKIDANSSKDDEVVDIGEGTWEEIYKGVLTMQFRLLKMFSIGSSVLGLCMQPILYEQIGNANIGLVVAFGSFIGFFTFATPCLIHYVSKKYVTKLEYDSERDVYAATTLTFFLREKKVHFRPDDVIRPEIPGMFTSFVVKNRALFVDPYQFDDVDHYSRIMGYDKPIDFRPDWVKHKDSS